MSYIVVNDTQGAAAMLVKTQPEADYPKRGTLFVANVVATEFPTRAAAQAAIARTEAYQARTRGNGRRADDFLIVRLQPEGLAR